MLERPRSDAEDSAPSEPAGALLDGDHVLFGHDAEERIVALHPVPGPAPGADGGEAMRVYRRTEDDQIEHADRPFYPFFFLSEIALLQGFPRGRFRFQRLQGDGFFQYLVAFESRNAYWDAMRHVGRQADTVKGRPDAVYSIGPPEQQYLMQSGQTLFKGMEVEHLHRLQLDIEVSAETGFPDAGRPEHEVIIVAMSDNRGWSRLVHAQGVPEKAVLEETLRLVAERDPDVIEGHNCFGFDLPYLRDRCRLHRVPFTLGRDGSEPRFFPASIRFAERTIDYEACEIAGRHIVDTLFQVMAFDVFKRNMPNYTLKGAAKYFGFAPEGRTYVPGDEIWRVWRDDPARLLDYALDDVVETEALARRLSGSTFYLAQMVPMPYGTAARTGPAAKIESLFVRSYLRERYALPRADYGSQTVGGYTDVFVTGVVGPVVYADVESLYPSIMLHYDVRPKDDALGVFPGLLRRLTDLRFETKAAMRETSSAGAQAELDARQTAYKNIINSFYGNMGFGMAVFNDFAEADRVAAIGQELLRQIIGLVRQRGGLVVEVDTDGVLFVPPGGVRGEAEERAFVQKLSQEMPAGIRIGFDGRFQKMLSYKKKNYALLGYDGALKFKGSSLVSRSSERFGRRFVREAIRLLLDEDIQGLHDLYLATRDLVLRHRWTGAEDFQRTETLKDTLRNYRAAVKGGKRTRSAAYELAARRQKETGQPVRKGDRVRYYIAGEGTSAPSFEQAKLAEKWDASAPDENTAVYLARLDQLTRRFEPFFETDHQFRLVFSPEDLFGFSPDGIRLKRTERLPEELEDDVPF